MIADRPPSIIRRILTLAAAFSTAALTGCALLRGPAAGTAFVLPAQRQVNLGPAVAQSEARSVVYRSPSEYEEYDRWLGAARAEIIYSVANGPQTALDFKSRRLRALAQTWTFNHAGAPLGWAPTQYLNEPGRPAFTYALYQHSANAHGTPRHCMAFQTDWDPPPDDPRHRPGKALFGYYCAPVGQLLDRGSAIAVINGLVIDGDKIPRVYFGEKRPTDSKALATARGGRGTNHGNPGFPFQFSRYYTIGSIGGVPR